MTPLASKPPVRHIHVVALRPSDRRGKSIRDRLDSIAGIIDDITPAPIKRIARTLTKPCVAAPLTIAFFALCGIVTYYTIQFSSEIDGRLQSGALDNSVGIFSSPLTIAIGDRLSPAELASYLEGAGYQQKGKASQDPQSGSARYYAVNGSSIEVHPDRIASNDPAITPLRIEIDDSGHIRRLTRTPNNESVRSAKLEGQLLASLREGDRRKKIMVRFADIPKNLRNAILAIEDRRFFSHSGIDWRGTVRALWTDLRHGDIVQGGSTLTQQLVKNSFLSGERTLGRKVKEAAMAIILESRLSKEEIFTLYCNDVYLGQSGTFAVNGVAQAARAYFGRDLSDLTLGESAFVAGLINAPNRYLASNHVQAALDRRNAVLDAMVETGDISTAEAEAAKHEALRFKELEAREDNGSSFFIDYAERCIEGRYGARLTGGSRVVTTIDPRLQRIANDAVNRTTERLDRIQRPGKGNARPVQAALVALDPHNGEVLAMIGGRRYDQSQLNRATDARRQPGSTFKPFVYAAALSSRRFTAASLISDRPQTFAYDGGHAGYSPSNYHGAFSYRDVTLREALARSMNVPAVALAMDVGLSNVAAVAESCGLSLPNVYPSMALGACEATPLEMAAAYTAFVNGGVAVRPTPLTSVAEPGDQTTTLAASSETAFSPQVAYLMTSMMESVVDAGTAARLRGLGLHGALAGKTGTSNDGWFVGYTPNLVCAVWVGYDDNTDLRMKAADTALPLWADFVKQAIDVRPELGGDSFVRPSGIVETEIDPTTGLIATPECSERRRELFIAGAEPLAECTHGSAAEAGGADEPSPPEASDGEIRMIVCADSGLLASSSCPHPIWMVFASGKEPHEICGMDHYGRVDDRQVPAEQDRDGAVKPERPPARQRRSIQR